MPRHREVVGPSAGRTTHRLHGTGDQMKAQQAPWTVPREQLTLVGGWADMGRDSSDGIHAQFHGPPSLFLISVL